MGTGREAATQDGDAPYGRESPLAVTASRNRDLGLGIWDSQISNLESQIPNPKSQIPNPESRIPNPVVHNRARPASTGRRGDCPPCPRAARSSLREEVTRHARREG